MQLRCIHTQEVKHTQVNCIWQTFDMLKANIQDVLITLRGIPGVTSITHCHGNSCTTQDDWRASHSITTCWWTWEQSTITCWGNSTTRCKHYISMTDRERVDRSINKLVAMTRLIYLVALVAMTTLLFTCAKASYGTTIFEADLTIGSIHISSNSSRS